MNPVPKQEESMKRVAQLRGKKVIKIGASQKTIEKEHHSAKDEVHKEKINPTHTIWLCVETKEDN